MVVVVQRRRQQLILFFLLIACCSLVVSVHGVVYFQREDGTTCINGICYGIDPSIYKYIPMFNDCVDLRVNCPERVHECKPPGTNNDDDNENYSLVTSTTTTTTTILSSSSSSWRYVQAHCPKTCGVCHERIRSVPLHEAWEPPPIGYPDNHVVVDGAAASLNDDDLNMGSIVQILDADGTHDHVNAILDLLAKTRDYLQHQVAVQDRYKLVRHACVNHHEYCAYWAAVANACQNNAPYMLEKCPAVCFMCHELHEDAKCPKYQSSSLPSLSLLTNPDTWKRGDLHRMFQSLVSDPDFAQYSPKILSRPQSNSSSSLGDDGGVVENPWIVQLDDFLDDAEVDRFLELHGARGNKGGRATTKKSSSSSKHGRIHLTHPTSHVRNCTGACEQDEVVMQILNRIERLTGIPVNNTEPLQLHRSQHGEQQQEARHDYLQHQVERMEGPRILSIVLFLNKPQHHHDDHDDESSGDTTTNENDSSSSSDITDDSIATVAAAAAAAAATTTITSNDGGGQVVFPRLNNLSVAPKRGRALLWPNVLNDNPNLPDFRTAHYTRPVIVLDDKENHQGSSSSSSLSVADMLLFRVNLWLHLRDFSIPKEMGCA